MRKLSFILTGGIFLLWVAVVVFNNIYPGEMPFYVLVRCIIATLLCSPFIYRTIREIIAKVVNSDA